VDNAQRVRVIHTGKRIVDEKGERLVLRGLPTVALVIVNDGFRRNACCPLLREHRIENERQAEVRERDLERAFGPVLRAKLAYRIFDDSVCLIL